MIKNGVKQIFYIFIYMLVVGCGAELDWYVMDPNNADNMYFSWSYPPDPELPWEATEMCGDEIYLDITAPDLGLDENGYYHMEFLDSYSQTFTTLEGQTGLAGNNNIAKVGWISDSYILYEWGQGIDTINAVNTATYTGPDGIVNTVLSIWPEFIGDTLTVYAGYRDGCDEEHFDFLKVVVEE